MSAKFLQHTWAGPHQKITLYSYSATSVNQRISRSDQSSKTWGMSGGAADVINLLPLSGSTVDIGQRSTLTLRCQKRKQYGS